LSQPQDSPPQVSPPQVSPPQLSQQQVIPLQVSADKSWPSDFCYNVSFIDILLRPIGITNFKRLLRFRSFTLIQVTRR
jgi:hypothetical protein